MRNPIQRLSRALAPLAVVFLLASCENEEQTAIIKQQKLEISRLDAELEEMKDRLDRSIPDHRKELKDTEEGLARLKEEIVETEAEIVTLGEDKRQLERQLADFQRDHPMPAN